MQNLPVSRLSTTLRALHTIFHRFLLTRNDEAIDIWAVKLRVSVIGLASPLGFRKMERVSPHLLRCVDLSSEQTWYTEPNFISLKSGRLDRLSVQTRRYAYLYKSNDAPAWIV